MFPRHEPTSGLHDSFFLTEDEAAVLPTSPVEGALIGWLLKWAWGLMASDNLLIYWGVPGGLASKWAPMEHDGIGPILRGLVKGQWQPTSGRQMTVKKQHM